MNINVSLRPDTQQSMLVTRQAIQSIEILQYGQDELHQFISEQIEKNPLITLSERTSDDFAPAASALRWRTGSRHAGSGPRLDVIEATVAQRTSLHEHLDQQLGMLPLTDSQKALSRYLIGSLEADGYLRCTFGSLSNLLEVDEAEIAFALRQVQRLEPVGIGARNLSECFRLQLEDRGELTREMDALLRNLDAILDGNPEKLARRINVSPNDILAMLRQFRGLDPSPGLSFECEPVSYAVPDIIVSPTQSGGFRVEVNPLTLPRVLFDNAYCAELSSQVESRPDRQYLNECARDADMLARNLNQRAATILKVAKEIARQQLGFLRGGVPQLRPLSQKTLAQACGVHESTVSRAIANKYLLCPHGQFPLKFFFSEGLANSRGDDGGDVASETIRHRIRSLVAKETNGEILSDDAIADILGRDGINVARRTIAKYRGQLRIPSSAERRRMRRLA